MGKHIYREELAAPEFLAAVMNADGNMPDPRIVRAAATGSGEAVPSDGGFLVPTDFSSDLWQAVYQTGEILSRCTGQPITVGKALKIPAIDETSRAKGSRFGAVQNYWLGEGGAPTASRPKFKSIDLKAKKLLSLCYATDELVADVAALAGWLERIFSLEAAFEIENQIINGLGADRPLGILNSGALITVSKETGQLAATVMSENIVNMWARMWTGSKRNAVWLINSDVMPQLLAITVGVGPTSLITWANDGTLLLMGRPVIEVEYCATVGAKGDIILADLSQYIVGEIAPAFISSIHVLFLQFESAFKLRYRLDGQSAWTSPTTPLNGAATVSPFVTLGART